TSQGEQQQALVAEFERAVAELDLAAAEAIVERIAVHLGGTAIAVSQHRDLLHRLGFYLQRIGRGRGTVERLGELQPDAQLQPLLTFLGECDQRAARGGETPTPMGLRHLQFALANLAEEFPSLRPRTEPCTALLTAALQQLTDEAWSVVAEAQAKLAAVPVPVRPLQTLLHRLDACRMLEALVDRPQRPRTQLMDRVESLRLKLEQARATRDRLASGAELAIARGHWTTGLFDMERAVTSLADVEDDDASGATERRLRERLAEARRRKQELEAATRRNVALAARYAELQDDAGSSFAERLHVLRERRDCLQFLSLHLAAERNELYGRDLRDVESQIAHERAGQAEAELDATEDAHERLRLVQRTLVMLGESAVGSASGETSGRVLRLLEHWRSLVGNAQREIDRRRELALIRQRSRRRRVATAVLAAMLLVAFALWQWGPLGRPAGAADRFFALLQRASPVQQIAADPVSAVLALRELAHALPAVQHEAADALVDEVRRMLEPRADLVPLQWHAGLLQQLQAASAAGAATAQWQAFVLQAWRTGTVLAALHCGDASEWDRLLARLDPAAGQPAGSAAPALPAAFAIELQQLRH
ncbi:MAG TPA: hypothetical protein VK348_05380, partial [Planctomycetota bacterium]|nr:hypothetical protein [Planctomycetota bacterium]